ncbi:hypothetical protein MUZ84_004679 [Salmonella enterica]|nr:hypothetical protein [Salmonella enterica]EKN4993174.1 hypothetical protein [Salmonella enterica]
MLKVGIEDVDGELLKGGGGVAKDGKSKDTQIWTGTKKAEPVGNAYGHWIKHGKEFPEYQNAKQYRTVTVTTAGSRRPVPEAASVPVQVRSA